MARIDNAGIRNAAISDPNGRATSTHTADQAAETAKNVVSGLGHLARSAAMVAQAAVKGGGMAAREISASPMQAAVKAADTKAGAVTQMAAGTAIAAAGVPMLILPGPGIAAIAGGVALASNGARKAFGMKKRAARPACAPIAADGAES